MVRFIAPEDHLDPEDYARSYELIKQGKELLMARLGAKGAALRRAEEGRLGKERPERAEGSPCAAGDVPARGRISEAELARLPESVRGRIEIAERQRARYARLHPSDAKRLQADDGGGEGSESDSEAVADSGVKAHLDPNDGDGEYAHIYSVWPLDLDSKSESDASENVACPSGTTIMNFLQQSTLKSSTSISPSGPTDESASGRTATMGTQHRLGNTSNSTRRMATARRAIVASLCGAVMASGLCGGLTPAIARTIPGADGPGKALETTLDLTSQRGTVRLGEDAAFKITGTIGDILGDDLDARIDLKLPGSKDQIDLEDAEISVSVNGVELEDDEPKLDFGDSSASLLVKGLSPRDTVTCDVVVPLEDEQLEGKRVRMESSLTVAGRERCDDRASVVVADKDDPVSDLEVVEEGDAEIEGGTRHLIARFSPASGVSDGTVTVGAVPDGARLENFELLDVDGNEIDSADSADDGGTVFTGVSAGGDEVAAVAFELTADEETMSAERGRIPVSVSLDSASMRAPLHVSRIVDLSAVDSVDPIDDGDDDKVDQDRLEAIKNILAESSGSVSTETEDPAPADGDDGESDDSTSDQGISTFALPDDGGEASARDGAAKDDSGDAEGSSSASEASASDTTFAMSFSATTSNVKAGDKASFTLIAKPSADAKSVELVVTPAKGITIEEGSVKASISGSSSVMPSYSVEKDGKLKVTVDEIKADQRLMVEYDGTVGSDQKDGAQLSSKAVVSIDGTEASTRDYVITVGTAAETASEPSGNGADALQADSAAGNNASTDASRSNGGANSGTSTSSAASAVETAGKALGKTGVEGTLILPVTGTVAIAGIAFCLDRYRRSGSEDEA